MLFMVTFSAKTERLKIKLLVWFHRLVLRIFKSQVVRGSKAVANRLNCPVFKCDRCHSCVTSHPLGPIQMYYLLHVYYTLYICLHVCKPYFIRPLDVFFNHKKASRHFILCVSWSHFHRQLSGKKQTFGLVSPVCFTHI